MFCSLVSRSFSIFLICLLDALRNDLIDWISLLICVFLSSKILRSLSKFLSISFFSSLTEGDISIWQHHTPIYNYLAP